MIVGAHAPRKKGLKQQIKRLKTRCCIQKVCATSRIWKAAHSSLRELVPQGDSSWEETLLVDGIGRPNLVEARVMLVEGVRYGSTGMSTRPCTIRNIILSLAKSLRFCIVSQARLN